MSSNSNAAALDFDTERSGKGFEKTSADLARVNVKNPYLVMTGLYLGAFMGMFSETSLNIAMPALTGAFSISTGIAQWLVTGYMLVIGLVLPFASLLMKWFPVRKLTAFALGMFLTGSLISGSAPVFPVLLTGRLIQGVGTGLVLPMMFAVILEVFPPKKIGAAMGLTALIIMVAPAVGPTLSGLVLGALSWRWLFFIFAAVLAVSLVFTAKYMVDPYKLTKPSIDIPSCILSCAGFGGIVLGAGLASIYGWISAPVLSALVIGVIALIVYAKRQFAIKDPVLNLNVFRIRRFAVSSILVMTDFGITLSAMYLFPQYLQNGAGFAVALTGMIMLPGGIVNAAVSLLSGKLYDRIGAVLPTKLGFLFSAAGAVLLIMTTTSSSIAFIMLCHVALMVGVPLAMSPSQSYGLNALPPELSADGSTVMNTMQQVFGAIATAVATSLLGIGQGAAENAGADPAHAFTAGTHTGVLFTLALAVIGFVVSFGVKKVSR